jgi:pimeloyl-ACP methyl ester carboxylesterase
VDYAMRVVSADNAGVRIEATEWFPPPGAEAQGLPLVFIPGGTNHARTHEVHGHAGAMGRLGARARRVLAVSRRGTGLSDAPPTGYTPADFARDVRAAVDAAQYKRFALFGHSIGVPIGLEFALRQSRGLVGLALGDAPPQYIKGSAGHF